MGDEITPLGLDGLQAAIKKATKESDQSLEALLLLTINDKKFGFAVYFETHVPEPGFAAFPAERVPEMRESFGLDLVESADGEELVHLIESLTAAGVQYTHCGDAEMSRYAVARERAAVPQQYRTRN